MVDRERCGYGPEELSRQIGRAEKCLDVKPVRTAFRGPWQDGIAERFVGSCQKELFDYVIVLDERHRRRLIIPTVSTCRSLLLLLQLNPDNQKSGEL